jgi:hypothetical protein
MEVRATTGVPLLKSLAAARNKYVLSMRVCDQVFCLHPSNIFDIVVAELHH